MIKGQSTFGGFLDEASTPPRFPSTSPIAHYRSRGWGRRQWVVERMADALERDPSTELVRHIQDQGLIMEVRDELERRSSVIMSVTMALTAELITEHERSASKSQDEKKRVAYVIRECPELYLERGNKYSDLFWPCGTARVDPEELSPMRPLRSEIAAITAEYMDPESNTVKVCESCAALWMRYDVTGERCSRCMKCGHKSWRAMSQQAYSYLQATKVDRMLARSDYTPTDTNNVHVPDDDEGNAP